MGYSAPRVPADDARFARSRNLHITKLIPGIGLGGHEGFVVPRLDPPKALSWLPVDLGYEERELLDHCKPDRSVL